ncbi:hypothetical protein [Nocardia nova]
MSNSKRRYRKNADRRIYVRGERHDPPSTYLLARALFALAAEMAAAKAKPEQAQASRSADAPEAGQQRGPRS